MKQITQNYRTGKLEIVEVPIPTVKRGGVLVKNCCSLISAGTERLSIELAKKSIIRKAKERPDLVRQTIAKVKSEGILPTLRAVVARLDTPIPLGYSSSGTVVEVSDDVDEFKVGDRVACGGGGYATHSEFVFVPQNLCVKIPDNVDFESAAFTVLGAVALQGVRRAELTLGENVAVIGLGLIGQLTLQILGGYGCKVVGIDIDEAKVKLALDLGVDCTAVRGKDDVLKIIEEFSNGYGVDAVLITAATESNDPIELAGKISRDKGRVVVVGAVKMDIPRRVFYEKELDLRISRSYGPGRYDTIYEEKGIDYPIGYVRWTEKRNMQEFLNLVSRGIVALDKIITHRFSIDEADRAYKLITGEVKENYMGIILKYPQEKKAVRKIVLKKTVSKACKPGEKIKVGVIGAGNFAKTVLLPILKKISSIELTGVAAATGISSKYVGEKFSFRYCTSDYHNLIEDPDINTIVIATRHNMHSKLVIEALDRDKNVFVEKPLCLSENELARIIESWRNTESQLMVGFNRRFSTFVVQAMKFFEKRSSPMCVSYRINAGFVPKDNWVQDVEEGGGRIIGEVCHFVDLIYYLVGAMPIKVYAEAISGTNQEITNNDNVLITLKFQDGSIGSINYFANGDKSFPKERIEVFCENSIFVIDNFRSATFIREGKITRTRKLLSYDKGHENEFREFFKAVEGGRTSPISFKDIVVVTQVTFKIMESLAKGKPIELNFTEQYER